MAHIILLGDSIFDNSNYVYPDADVVAQLQHLLPTGWQASLLAVDGAVTNDIAGQLNNLPADATHLVLSVGGNDLLHWTQVLPIRLTTSSQVLLLLKPEIEAFEPLYRSAVEACLKNGLPLIVCTIYNCDIADQEFQPIARIAITAFDDVILRVSQEKGVQAIDLRLVCEMPEDYADEIEPSAIGGGKIAAAIWRAISHG
jgi:hypothetical protein